MQLRHRFLVTSVLAAGTAAALGVLWGTILAPGITAGAARDVLIAGGVVLAGLLGWHLAVRIARMHGPGPATPAADSRMARLEATLEHLDHGVVLVDEDLRLRLFNRRFVELFELHDVLARPRVRAGDLLRHGIGRGEFGRVDDPDAEARRWVRRMRGGRRCWFEHVRPNGRVVEIRGSPLPGGGLVVSFADITARRRAVERAAHLACHDSLTGLPNRRAFRDRLELAVSRSAAEAQFALLYVDLNEFKDINDTLGHGVGDRLLREAARRLREAIAPDDFIARLGGDEFAIIHPCRGDGAEVTTLARRVVACVDEPYLVDGGVLHIGAAVGITRFPEHSRAADCLCRNADLAMYAAKAEGRSGFTLFTGEMLTRIRARKSMEDDLRYAVERGEMSVHYQPRMNMRTGAIVGVEALLRWRHPERGDIAPDEFIPLAERTGLIVPIGEWVLETACAFIRDLRRRGHPDLQVSVNLSAIQLRHPGLAATVGRILEHCGIEPGCLELELTESAAVRDADAAIRTLEQLRALDVRLSIDDFGTGFSSLSQVRRLPVDCIKMDGAFLRGAGREDTAIVNAILAIGEGLDLPIVAEGVETLEQLEFLRAGGCAESQGFHISRPLPGPALVEWLNERETGVVVAAAAAEA